MAASKNVTQLLADWRAGDQSALDELTPVIYDQLRRLAGRYMHSEQSGHTLQATALVSEAYLRLAGAEVPWQDRAHFLAVAARVMRRILIDHAKAKRSQKRGGDRDRITLEESAVVAAQPPPRLLDLDEALTRLEELDERKARVVELHFFGGLTYDGTAEVLEISRATVDRELRLAKAGLHDEL